MRKRIGLTAFARRVANLGPELEKTVGLGLQDAGIELKREVVREIDRAKPFPAVDQGLLRASVSMRTTKRTVVIGVDAPHADAIENGTRPFFPPIEPLIGWVKRKGFATGRDRRGRFANREAQARSIAYAVQQKIGRDGIEPRHYMRKAWARFRARKVAERCIARRLEALARRGRK